MITPSPDEFCRLAEKYPVVPVELRALSDVSTPIGLYSAMRDRSRYSFLLESVQGGEARARYSFAGSSPREIFGSVGGQAFQSRGDGRPVRDPVPALRMLRRIGSPATSPVLGGLPPFVGGAVGYVAYDAAPLFGDVAFRSRGGEGAGDRPAGTIPEVFFMTFDRVVCVDHLRQTLSILGNVFPRERDVPLVTQYRQVVAELEELHASLGSPPALARLSIPEATLDVAVPERSSFERAGFLAAVERIKEYIRAGDIFQGVLSQRFTVPAASVDALDVYRVLRFLNPSPYMYCLNFGSFQVVGTSPEALVRLSGDVVEVRPIAGTRRRGTTPEEDMALEAELRADPKERAEHVMLVDLGRNDVGRVSRYGSVAVTELMQVERYSHVMHLVSSVRGARRDGLDAIDVLAAGFPAGTVTGAPKIRAMQILDELEPVRRGLYAGGIGYFSYTGSMDSCIAIRTMVLQDGFAHIQGGAGIVADSVPEHEYQETVNKAKALIQALRFVATPGGGAR
jgi:anthranilate synthase component 1